MRVSEYFNLRREQPTLDFVDVDVHDDVRIFLDPHALRLLPSTWGAECASLVENFFRTVIAAIKANDHATALRLLGNLREPNETHLGLSKGRSRGRALGEFSAQDVWKALQKSEAVRTGLIDDLEDTILMVEGIDRDIISDITTNLIREPLIHYTQDACRAYGIPMEAEVDSGPLWNPNTGSWNHAFVELPTIEGMRLLLVPKAIVRRRMNYDAGEYYRHYILEELQQQELRANSSLVKLARDGSKRVTFKSLKEKYGYGKPVIVRETLRKPELLQRYRDDRAARITPPMSHEAIAEIVGTQPPKWDELVSEVTKIQTGPSGAAEYEKAIDRLLTALFYPALTNPQLQFPIHDGRKRIDITYTNVARFGFFYWLALHYPAPHPKHALLHDLPY